MIILEKRRGTRWNHCWGIQAHHWYQHSIWHDAINSHEPSSQLKPITLQLHLIGRGIKSVENSTYLTFHHANGIGKNCNSLLRLVRHFVCGHIVNTARDGIAPFNHDDFMNNTYQLLKTIQISISIDAVCRCIWMAKHIESKVRVMCWEMFCTTNIYPKGSLG